MTSPRILNGCLPLPLPPKTLRKKIKKEKNYFVQDFGDGKNGLLLLTFKSIDKHIKEI